MVNGYGQQAWASIHWQELYGFHNGKLLRWREARSVFDTMACEAAHKAMLAFTLATDDLLVPVGKWE